MKYVMFEHAVGEGVRRRIPIIFPDQLVHSEVAESIRHMMAMKHKVQVKVVSAGFIDLLVTSCRGESETLGIGVDEEDQVLINTMDYLHGIVE